MADPVSPSVIVHNEPEALTPATPRPFSMPAPRRPEDTLSVLGAAFGIDNPVVNAFDMLTRPAYEPVEGYSPLDEIEGTYYSDFYLDRFVGAVSPDETRDIRARIDREEDRRRVLADAGGEGALASLIAGAADPTFLLPLGGWLVPAIKGGRAASVAVRAAEGALITGGAVLGQETILQAAQETRTFEESAFAVGAGTLLGAILGGGAAALTRSQADEVAGRLFSMPATREEEVAAFDAAVAATTGVGAQATSAARGSGELKPAFGAERLAFQDPMFRLSASPLEAARNAGRDLYETPLTLAESADGIATTIGGSAETQSKLWTANLGAFVRDYDRAWLDYWKRVNGKGRVSATVARGFGNRGGSGLTFKEFQLAVSRAAREGDQSEIPEVQRAAQSFRANVDDPLKEAAIRAGLFGEDVAVTDDVSHLFRAYRREIIKARRPQFEDILVQHFKVKQEGAAKAASGLRKKLEEKQFEIEQSQGRVAEELARVQAAFPERLAEAAPQARQRFYRKLLADLKRGRPTGDQPVDLIEFMKSRGGMRLARTDVDGPQAVSATRSDKIRRVIQGNDSAWATVRSDGLEPGAMLRVLKDAGYLPSTATIDDLVAALKRSVEGRPVFSEADADIVGAAVVIRSIVEELARRGVNVDDMSTAQLMDVLSDTAEIPMTPAMKAAAEKIEGIVGRISEGRLTTGDLAQVIPELNKLDPELLERARSSREAVRMAGKEISGLEQSILSRDEFADLTEDELLAAAQETVDTILGTSPNRITTYADLVTGPRGPLKERVLRIPTRLIEDFVENDPETLARLTIRAMAPDIALIDKFGDINLTGQIAAINDEAARLARAATTDTERTRIAKAQSDAIRDLTHIRDRIRGTAGIPDDPSSLIVRTGRVVRSLNYLRLLGGMTLSALPDPARLAMVYGVQRAYGAPLAALIRGSAAFKGAMKEAQLAGTAWDMVLDTRAMAIADVFDDYAAGGSAFERGVMGATRKFGLVSLMAPWNQSLKQFTGVVAQTKLFDMIGRIADGTATVPEKEFAAAGGIDANVAERIAAQFRAHGRSEDGVNWANSGAWTDPFAVQAFRSFLVREVDRVIITPGMDRPIWMDSETGKLIGQFKSFGLATTQRTLVSGLQQRDMAVVNGAVLMLALGMVSYAAKQATAGRDISDDPRVWITEGVDRSGLLAWLTDINNVAEKATGGRVGLSAITGEQASRYASRNIVGALIGPTAGTITDLAAGTRALATGEVSRADLTAVRRLLPAQNLFYLRGLFDQVEQGAGDALGVPERAN